MSTRDRYIHRQIKHEQADYEGIAAVINAHNESIGSERRVTPTQIESDTHAPDFESDQSHIVADSDHIVAYGEFYIAKDLGIIWAGAYVLPEYRGQDIHQSVVDWSEQYGVEKAAALLPADQPLSIRTTVNSLDKAGLELYQRNGYAHVRTFHEMHIDLADIQPPAELPDGIRFVPFDREKHGYALYEAHEDAFSEHWGHTRDTWEEWQHYVYDAPDNPPDLWLIAWEGDQIAGYAVNRQFRANDPSLAWVGILGVLKPYRKRGLGAALLNHSFALFKARGFTQAGLGVDAENTTNAVKLYERVGMHVHQQRYAYEKRLGV